MADASIDTLKRIYAGWGRGDFTVGVGDFDPDVVLVMDAELPDAGTYEGVEGIAGYTRQFLEAWESLTIVAESFEEEGGRVLVKVRQDGVGKDSGVPIGFSYFHVWTFRDGKVVRLESILREEVARQALGAASG